MLVLEKARADQIAKRVILLVEREDAGGRDTGVNLDLDLLLPWPKDKGFESAGK